MSVTETHSVGTTWTKGGDLGIPVKGLSLGASWSVSTTVTDSVGESTVAKYPQGPWHCSMQIVPSMAKVTGHLEQQDGGESCPTLRIDANEGGEENKPFEYDIPIKDSSGNGKWTYDVCTCGNLNKKNDSGHPAVVCPEDCTPHQ